ncbi:Bug family tripartite tricarboxylate transporter substrate binding protein [Bordetella genomosp. 9]|nr:tripartite tricarboxylate transporter substrate binding protein [Bordetella genomosp. 9]
MNWQRLIAHGALAGTMAALAVPSHADDASYPNKAVRIILPLAVGSSGDVFTRLFAKGLTDKLGQQFYVENMPSANGLLAAQAQLRAPADGYTILEGTSAIISLNPITVKDPGYDPVKDFRPVGGILRTAQIFAVPASSPIKSMKDLVEVARSAKAPLSSGTYGPLYLAAQQWFSSKADIKFNSIYYKGATGTAADLAGGQLDLAVVDLVGILPLVKGGRVRMLAVTSERRLPDFPDLPTVQESGFPGFVSYAWASLYVRTQTPDAVVNRLAKAMGELYQDKSIQTLMAQSPGIEMMPLGPEAMRKFQLAETERLREIAKTANLSPQ